MFELTTTHAQCIACILEVIDWLQTCRRADFQVHKQHQPGMTVTLRAEHGLKKRMSNKKITKRGKRSGKDNTYSMSGGVWHLSSSEKGSLGGVMS